MLPRPSSLPCTAGASSHRVIAVQKRRRWRYNALSRNEVEGKRRGCHPTHEPLPRGKLRQDENMVALKKFGAWVVLSAVLLGCSTIPKEYSDTSVAYQAAIADAGRVKAAIVGHFEDEVRADSGNHKP